MSLARAVFAASVLLSVSAHAADTLPRLTGAVTYENYPKIAAYLIDSLEETVALDLTIPLNNDESDGNLSTFVLDGQFELAYHAASAGSLLYADVGFDLVEDRFYTLKGAYTVKPGEVESGLPVVTLEAAKVAKNATYEDLPVDGLAAD